MTTPRVTDEGKIELQYSVGHNRGVPSGDEVEVDILPNAKLQPQAPQKKHHISSFFGSLQQENGPRLTIEEMNEIIAQGWSGEI